MRIVVVSILLVAVVSACNPNDCSGQGFNGQNVNQGVDKGAPANLGNPLCQGTNTTTNGDVNITNNVELNQLKNCKTVVGNISITNSTDIKDLSVLATLTTISQGYLLIQNNAALTDVELPALTECDDGIGIIDNPAVTAANFGAMQKAFGSITVRDNPELTQLGFPKLEQTLDAIFTDAAGAQKVIDRGNIIVGNNPKFTGFSTFTQLNEISGFLQVFGDDALTDFTGLNNLQKIDNNGKNAQGLSIGIDFDDSNDIIPFGNKNLKDLNGFDILQEVDNGDVFIGFNPAMQHLTGMANVSNLDKNLFVVGNDSLQDLDGLQGDGGVDGSQDGLQTVKGSIFIGVFFDAFKQPRPAGNGQLTNLVGLNSLTTLNGSLVLGFNNELKNFQGLDALPLIGGDLVLAGSSMDDFSGADALTTINGNFVIGQFFGNDDAVLTQLFDAGPDGLFNTTDDVAHPTRVTVNLDVNNNGNTAFPALTTIGKDLVVSKSDTKNLRIANALDAINGRLIMHDSDLNDLTGLESLNTLGGLVVGFAIDNQGKLLAGGNNNFSSFTGLNVGNVGAGGFDVGFNGSLQNFGGLSVTAVAGSVTIAQEGFANLNDLNLVAIGGDLNIGAIVNGNDQPVDGNLPNLTALQMNNLLNVGGNVLIAFNPKLTDVGFAALTRVNGKLEIDNEGQLVNVAGSDQLNRVGDLLLHDLSGLTTLNLPALAQVDQDLVLNNLPVLATVNLNSLATIGNNGEITFDKAIANLDFLSALNTVGNINARTGHLFIADDQNVGDTTGLNGLQSVGGDLVLARLAGVQHLTFNQLGQVGGTFEVNGMDGLPDFTDGNNNALPLQVVGNTLRVQDNAHLLSFAGLENLTTVGLAVAIENNPVLGTAQDDPNNVGGKLLQGILVDSGNRHVADQTGDLGLLALTLVGNANPPVDGVQGDRGVIEVQNNPNLDEAQLDLLIGGLTDNAQIIDGCDQASNQKCGLFFCGNQNPLSAQSPPPLSIDPLFDATTCGAVQQAP